MLPGSVNNAASALPAQRPAADSAPQTRVGPGVENAQALVTESAPRSSGGGQQPVENTKFGDVWKRIQAQYGEKPEKPREIKKTLGKDDFLKIMIMQMKNQDPTSPFKAEQFASQLAQYTSVEQMQNMNQTLSKIATQNQPLERLTMTNLIGKTVTVDRERFPHTQNNNDVLSFSLPRESKETHVMIMNELGEVVLEKEIGPQKQGDGTFVWDGVMSNTLPAKNGTYIFRVAAKDANDQPIPTDTKSQAKVIGVSFEGAEPVFLVGDPSRPDKVALKNLVRIESGGDTGLIPGARSLAEAVGNAHPVGGMSLAQPGGANARAEAQSANNSEQGGSFFSFQKGVGSSNIDPMKASSEQLDAIQKYQQQQAQAQAGAHRQAEVQRQFTRASEDGEKGFPNGLSDND